MGDQSAVGEKVQVGKCRESAGKVQVGKCRGSASGKVQGKCRESASGKVQERERREMQVGEVVECKCEAAGGQQRTVEYPAAGSQDPSGRVVSKRRSLPGFDETVTPREGRDISLASPLACSKATSAALGPFFTREKSSHVKCMVSPPPFPARYRMICATKLTAR